MRARADHFIGVGQAQKTRQKPLKYAGLLCWLLISSESKVVGLSTEHIIRNTVTSTRWLKLVALPFFLALGHLYTSLFPSYLDEIKTK